MTISKVLFSDLQILGAAFFFGIGFIAQKEISIDGMGPMTCNALRFTLSGVLLFFIQKIVPIHWINNIDAKDESDSKVRIDEESQLLFLDNKIEIDQIPQVYDNKLHQLLNISILKNNSSLKWGIILGIINFFGSGFQQWALNYISASKVSFLAGFDLFLTPLIGLIIPSIKHFHEQETKGVASYNTWLAIFISFIGVFFLSGSKLNDLSIGFGEFLTIISAFFWSFHIIYTDVATYSPGFNSLKMMTIQMFIVGLLSFIASRFQGDYLSLTFIISIFPLLLFLSLVEGIGFVLMAEGQKFSPPTHAALILALEGFFTSLCDYFILGEILQSGEIFGCFLMIMATIIAKFGISDLIKFSEYFGTKMKRLIFKNKPLK